MATAAAVGPDAGMATVAEELREPAVARRVKWRRWHSSSTGGSTVSQLAARYAGTAAPFRLRQAHDLDDEVVFLMIRQFGRRARSGGRSASANDLFTHKLSDAEIAAIQNRKLRVVVARSATTTTELAAWRWRWSGGESSYAPDDVERIELGRFVPLSWIGTSNPMKSLTSTSAQPVSVLRDAALRAAYDLWLELELFGCPTRPTELPVRQPERRVPWHIDPRFRRSTSASFSTG